eukprot:4416480-Alexandrium_andersonii.AAC.1
MPNLPTKCASGRAGDASRGGVRRGGAPPGSPELRNGISIEPNRSTEPTVSYCCTTGAGRVPK